MELSKNVLNGIAIAANESIVSDSVYNLILQNVFEKALCNKGEELHVIEMDEKLAYASMMSLLLEVAKHDVHSAAIGSLLDECQMSSQRAAAFLNKYQENKDKIQIQLSKIGSSYDQIVDATWRQDYIIKSSHCEKICEPSYVISLKTWNSQTNSGDDVTFGCSMEQLQDLVLKLKDATKCIERIANA